MSKCYSDYPHSKTIGKRRCKLDLIWGATTTGKKECHDVLKIQDCNRVTIRTIDRDILPIPLGEYITLWWIHDICWWFHPKGYYVYLIPISFLELSIQQVWEDLITECRNFETMSHEEELSPNWSGWGREWDFAEFSERYVVISSIYNARNSPLQSQFAHAATKKGT